MDGGTVGPLAGDFGGQFTISRPGWSLREPYRPEETNALIMGFLQRRVLVEN